MSMFAGLLAILFFIFPFVASAISISNAGFIPAPLWFSRDTFFAGETVRVYTVLYNGSESDIRGTVEFLNDTAIIGSDDFSLAKGGRSQDIWIDWKATEGDHRIFARIVRARAAATGGKEEFIDLSQALTAEAGVSVDSDTDKDGVGNKIDPDDDNDGISDADEIRAGTNPLLKDASAKSAINQDSVSYNTNSPADKVVDEATRKASDTGSAILSFAESARGKGSVLLARKTIEARNAVSEARSRVLGVATTTPPAASAKQISDIQEKNDFFASVRQTVSSFAPRAPFAYVKYFIFTVFAFIFRHAPFFYLLALVVAYVAARFILRFVRNR